MRRIFVVLLSVVLVLGFSFAADARHQTEETEYNPGMVTAEGVQIKMSGSLRTRGEFRNNVQLGVNDDGNNRAAFDSRVRLKFDARVTPNTMGVIELENDGIVWGADDRSAGTYDEGNSTKGSLDVRQAYIAHQGSGLLGRTAGIKVGHMLLSLGNGLFYDHTLYGDDAVILWTGLGDGEISFNYVKLEEGSAGDVNSVINNNDDATAYVLALEYPMANMNMSADVTYIDDQEPDLGEENLQLWNFGLRGDMNMAGLDVRGDIEFQTGEVKDEDGDIDIQAWAFLVGADYAIGDISVGAEVAYGSGDSDPDDSDWEEFTTLLGSFQKYTYVYDYRAETASTNPAGSSTNTGIANTWYINIGASAMPAPDLKAMIDLYYLKASEDVSLRGGEEDDELGWEIDGKIEYKIDKNLVYFIEGGYLMPGDAYKNSDGDDADDAYAVRNGVLLKF